MRIRTMDFLHLGEFYVSHYVTACLVLLHCHINEKHTKWQLRLTLSGNNLVLWLLVSTNYTCFHVILYKLYSYNFDSCKSEGVY